MIENFPGIQEVALAIALDNGMINRNRSKESFLAECDNVLATRSNGDLISLEAWVQTLTPEEREELAAGEDDEIEILEAASPRDQRGEHLADIFKEIFDAC